jgi:hypothetical protein
VTSPSRCFGASLAIVGLLLQVALGAAHSARHFDHLVGHLLLPANPLAATEFTADPSSPSPGSPAAPDFDHCAIGLALAAAGTGILPAGGIVAPPPARDSARLEAAPRAIAAISLRHRLPPARAPPAVAISV